MADDPILITVTGLEKLQANLDRLGDDIRGHLWDAGEEAGKEILNTVGLQRYPPATDANQPPTPYYIRGRGMQRAGIRRPAYNDGTSERLGTNWYVSPAYSGKSVIISNKVSYAPFVHGEEQSQAMARIGWRKLIDVAAEKIDTITRIYQGWIDYVIRKYGL
jgi:hypothetical protein